MRGIDCNERVCVSGSLDGRVRLFDLRTGSVSSAMRLSTSTIHSVQFGKCFLGFGFLLKDFCKWKRSTIGSSFQLEDLRIPCILVKNWLLIEKLKKKKKLVKGDFRIQHENLHKIVQHKNGVSSLVASAYNVVSCDYDGIVSVASVWDSKRKVFSKSCGEEV